MVSQRQHVFRLTTRRARSVTSSLFGVTFLACVLTVSASNVFPCPAHSQRGRFADGEPDSSRRPMPRTVVVEKRARRWIEERRPSSCDI
jgi:cytochrome c oxidase assembly factor 2